MSSQATTRMEEQMAARLEKMDQQNKMLQLLTQQQAEWVDGIDSSVRFNGDSDAWYKL